MNNVVIAIRIHVAILPLTPLPSGCHVTLAKFHVLEESRPLLVIYFHPICQCVHVHPKLHANFIPSPNPTLNRKNLEQTLVKEEKSRMGKMVIKRESSLL